MQDIIQNIEKLKLLINSNTENVSKHSAVIANHSKAVNSSDKSH